MVIIVCGLFLLTHSHAVFSIGIFIGRKNKRNTRSEAIKTISMLNSQEQKKAEKKHKKINWGSLSFTTYIEITTQH